MKLSSILLLTFTILLASCPKQPKATITLSLQGPPLKESPTEKPFPAYTKTLNYLKSDKFKEAIQTKLSAQTLEIKVDQVPNTTLFKVSITSQPDMPLGSISSAIKSTIDAFGDSEGEKFVIFSQDKG